MSAVLVTSASAQTDNSPPEVFAPYVEMIKELDLRRRVNVLYPNPQSLFDGLQVGFVNATTGNLTFRRRDIVTRAQGPVVFARVYDSRIRSNADLGTGWRLSLGEELLVDGDPRHRATALSFMDADGARVARMVDGDTTRTFEKADKADKAGTRYVVGWAWRTLLLRRPRQSAAFGVRLRRHGHLRARRRRQHYGCNG